jgi:hypothetical protein
MNKMMRALFIFVLIVSLSSQAFAFCGFYVAKADTKLFNKASRVAITRDGDRTVMTMANDYQGDLKEFAIVIPVPTFIEREQINVADPALLDHLDAYSAPRLVEYYDEDPCTPRMMMDMAAGAGLRAPAAQPAKENKNYGVTVEAEYTVGEYDIVILSAAQSGGLEDWLHDNNYKIPAGAAEILDSYIKQKNRFFVAKVNLEEQSKLGFKYLRPIQVAFESPKFMLPIRLGMINADGDQELYVFLLTKNGRVETTNYRTVKLPEGMDIPTYVKSDFGSFYKAMFQEQVKKEEKKAVFLEYAWDMGWCDPCAADPLSNDELRKLGVHWLQDQRPSKPPVWGGAAPSNVFISRLHVRYNKVTFPEDLMFQETSDKSNFQGRYVLRHKWSGDAKCDMAKEYQKQLPSRLEKEAQTLASLTGWELQDIRKKMELGAPAPADDGKKWWKDMWK